MAKDMSVGTAVGKVRTTRPVMIWPMLPRGFTAGDTVRVFGTVHNLTDAPRAVRAHLSAKNGEVLSEPEAAVTVPARGNVPVYWTYRAGAAGWADLLMTAKSDGGDDASLKRLPVSPAAVEEVVTAAGTVGHGKLVVRLPEGFDPKTASVAVTVAPGIAADMADTLPYLVEYPYGCVEQTMSRFLPALLVAKMLEKSGVPLPGDLPAKLPKVVDAGVKRLLQLQQPDGGWGWQGTSGTHEMMTPYALLGLLEAERLGYPCPNKPALDAGVARLKQFLDALRPTWRVCGPHVNDTLYCLAVLARREPVPETWWPQIEAEVGGDRMSDYGHALALDLAVRAAKKPLADRLAAELHKRAVTADDGRASWRTAGFSRWADNTTEVTAAALQALVAHDPANPLVPKAVAYLQSAKQGNRWDSTKDTAVALYALCDYLAAVKADPAAGGDVTARLNDGPAATARLDGPKSVVLTLPAADLKPGGERRRGRRRAGRGTGPGGRPVHPRRDRRAGPGPRHRRPPNVQRPRQKRWGVDGTG